MESTQKKSRFERFIKLVVRDVPGLGIMLGIVVFFIIGFIIEWTTDLGPAPLNREDKIELEFPNRVPAEPPLTSPQITLEQAPQRPARTPDQGFDLFMDICIDDDSNETWEICEEIYNELTE
jgi:hypothetical protein